MECPFRRKESACGTCQKYKCTLNENVFDYNPLYENKCWYYECKIDDCKCDGKCQDKVNRKIESINAQNIDLQNHINQNNLEIQKLKAIKF